MNIFDRIMESTREKLVVPPKNRLSREELLKGNCEPGQEKRSPKVVIPGIYNPDDVLKRYSSLKGNKSRMENNSSPVEVKTEKKEDPIPSPKEVYPDQASWAEATNPGILKGNLQFSGEPKEEEEFDAEMEISKMEEKEGRHIESKPLLQILEDWKSRYHEEISKWRQYEEKVNEWRDAVMNVLAKLQNDLQKAQQASLETINLRKILEEKDQEILRLREELDQVKDSH